MKPESEISKQSVEHDITAWFRALKMFKDVRGPTLYQQRGDHARVLL